MKTLAPCKLRRPAATAALILAAIAGGVALSAQARGDLVGAQMAEAARQLLAVLEPDQAAKARFELKDGERTNWHYVPIERKGLPMKEMNAVQRQLAFALLSSGLSGRGFMQAVTIMSLEQILWELENQSPKRDPERYFVSIFGEPGKDATWGWRVEGHHLSVNFTLVEGAVVSGTPIFFATNPAHVKTGPRAVLSVLAREEYLGRNLVNLLDDGQRAQAIIDDSPPEDILTKEEPRVKPLAAEGLAVSKMNGDQKKLLLELVREYVMRHREELARPDLAAIEEASQEQIFFAWAGGLKPGEGHYYRVQGPDFLLEYANVQNEANHVHAVWRDFDGDFGEDVLAKHFAQAHREGVTK